MTSLDTLLNQWTTLFLHCTSSIIGIPKTQDRDTRIDKQMGSLGFRGVIGSVGAGLVPAQTRATTRVAPTTGVNPLNSQ